MRLASTFGIAAALIAAPASAAPATAQPAPNDRNVKICEMITVTGSRLGTRRICATRAEWDERRRLDREEVEKGQRSPCVLQQTGGRGRPSC